MMRLERFLADGISTVHVLTACIPPPTLPVTALHLTVLPVRSTEHTGGVGRQDPSGEEVLWCRFEPTGGNMVKYGLSYQ